MDTRIGYPNEHLASNSDPELSSPAFATVIGLLMKGINDNKKKSRIKEKEEAIVTKSLETDLPKRKSIFDKWGEKFREFLDNAE